MSHSRVIAFTGTVGSGKSTHMKLLHSKLKTERIEDQDEFPKPTQKSDKSFTNKLVVLLAGEGGERSPRTKISFLWDLSGGRQADN